MAETIIITCARRSVSSTKQPCSCTGCRQISLPGATDAGCAVSNRPHTRWQESANQTTMCVTSSPSQVCWRSITCRFCMPRTGWHCRLAKHTRHRCRTDGCDDASDGRVRDDARYPLLQSIQITAIIALTAKAKAIARSLSKRAHPTISPNL